MEVMEWWYEWGMFLILLLDIAAIFWVFLDSANRHTNALSWRMGTVVSALLVLPSLLYNFAARETKNEMAGMREPFFWLGLLGGFACIVLALIYASVVASRHQPQPQAQGRATGPTPIQQMPGVTAQGQVLPSAVGPAPAWPAAQNRPKAPAWLFITSGPDIVGGVRQYQLNVGETNIGRSTRGNDVILPNDRQVSGIHAVVREQNGQFFLQDRGSRNGTFLRGQRIQSAMLLQDNDAITIGQTAMVFKRADGR